MEITLQKLTQKKSISHTIKPVMVLLLFVFSMSSRAQTCSIVGDTIVCSNQVNTYSTGYAGTYHYQWNAYGGVLTGSGTSVSVSWSNVSSGQVTLIVRDALNNIVCSTVLNVSIRPKPTPAIAPSYAVGCGIHDPKGGQPDKRDVLECLNACDSSWITYTTPNHPGSTYSWVITGAANYTPSTTNSITVYWTAIGSGTVKVIETDSFGCFGENELCVKIVGKPKALFTAMPTPVGGVINACLNQSILFMNLSSAGAGTPLTTYEWIWGDGQTTVQTAPAPNASHSYNTPGTYIVSLVVQNECRCKDTFQMKVEVSSTPGPDIACISTVCPGSVVTYHTSAACPTYQWSVTNGTIIGDSTNSSVTVMWGSATPAIITLSTPGCSGTCSSPTSLVVPVIPPSATIQGPNLVCHGDMVKYSISCNIPIDSIKWHLPGGMTLVSGDTINGHEITVWIDYAYTTGTIKVDYFHHIPGSTQELSCGGTATLAVSARPKLMLNGSTEICENAPLNIYHSPAVSGLIKWEVTDVSGSMVYFSNISSGTVPFALPSPGSVWTYGPGLFYVKASSLSGDYCNSPQQIMIKVNAAPPPPDSIVGPNPVCPSRPYSYLAFPTSSNYAIVWNVQNGAPSMIGGTSISVLWNISGPYILSAVQVDPLTGCKSQPLHDTIQSILPLTAPVIFGPDTVCSNTNVVYNVSVPGDNFYWTINPSIAGSVISGQGSGTITVEWNNYIGNATLGVVRTVCGQTISNSKNVKIIAPPTPSMTIPSVICAGVSAVMSTPTVAASYHWNFGDGSTGSGPNPSHIYSGAGNYIVTLTVTYSGTCSGTASATGSIMVNPKPNITISTPDPNLFCGPIGTVNMYVAAPVTGTSYSWYKSPATLVGTGNSYNTNALGSYYVVGTNSFGCQGTSNVIPIDTLCDTCSPDPAYTHNFTIIKQSCNTDSFSGSYTSGAINPRWNFDDPFSGSNTAVGATATHTFKEPGYYRVRFCVDVPNLSGTGYCELCKYIVDTIKYIPDFFDSMYCSSGSFGVKLINNTKRLSTLPIPSYSWSVMPGALTSSAVNPSFSLAAGTYNVTLTVNGTCTITKTIVVPQSPLSSFSIADSVCQGSPVMFTNTSVGYTSSNWNFGDGASSLITNPTRTYSLAGNYVVTLLVQNNYGCSSFSSKNVVVLPNTLSGSISPSDSTICEGDSILYTVNASGGYPGYQYMWSTVQSASSIWAKHTGAYYVDITDSKGCMYKTPHVNVLANPIPRPEIKGKKDVCQFELVKFGVNYPASGGYSISWLLQPDGATNTSSTFNYYSSSLGLKQLTVKVVGPTGCVGYDTLDFVVHANPTASISFSGSLCEGQSNQLIGSSPSSMITHTFWNNGSTQDTMITSVPDQYTYTVVDTFGCKGSQTIVVNPLPDFCGYQKGCYEICDTVSQLVWYAPKGYAFYQWYYNGNPIVGATSDTLHIPLYQSGVYQVEITSGYGCKAMSPETDISFVKCASCKWDVTYKIKCDKFDPITGVQTYFVTMTFNNGLGGGSTFNVVPMSGSISGLSPITLSAGINTISFVYIPTTATTSPVCFNLLNYLRDVRCDTTVCVKLPDCNLEPCKQSVTLEKIDCVGNDASGNPQYLVCVNVNWGGSPGSTLTVTTPSGTIVPNVFTLASGAQTFCFTFTDLPPISYLSTLYFSYYDPKAEKGCRDSIIIEHRPCESDCKFETYNNCARCKGIDGGISIYELDITLYNPFATPATVTVLPIAAGTFGTITPNPVAPGMQNVKVMFFDNPPTDTFICFKIMLSDASGRKCMAEVCMYLPPCRDDMGVQSIAAQASMKLAPNPAIHEVAVYYNVTSGVAPTFEIMDMTGRKLIEVPTEYRNGVVHINVQDLSPGTYLVRLVSEGSGLQTQRLIIVK
ncbi:MAG: PKD domain-containing protein [Bacteroidia bacterium]|nr:PKD domain-containing protein [Bacteroidia bacterium]